VKAGVNATGAVATAVVLVVVASVKFLHGAYIVLLLIPLLVLGLKKISGHYQSLAASLKVGEVSSGPLRNAVVVLVPGVHRGLLTALAYAGSITAKPEAVFVESDPEAAVKVREKWQELQLAIPLTIIPAKEDSVVASVTQYLRELRTGRGVALVTIVLPEYTVTHWWENFLHNQLAMLLKLKLMFEPGIVVTSIKYRAGS
jgi:hypothetical protein